MSRPVKNNADYFSHDAGASSSRTLTILFNHFGHDGISAWWQLLELITGSENHVIDTRNPDNVEFLAAKMRFKPERLTEILNKMADLNAIDFELFHDGYIWCQNLVERLSPVYKKRGLPVPIKPSITVTEKPVSVTETELLIPESTQSKVKERKVNKEEINKEEKKFQSVNMELLSEFLKLNGWGDSQLAKDDVWLSEFLTEFPKLSIPHIRACRDYHSKKTSNSKAFWKTRIRNWMENDIKYHPENKPKGEPLEL
ncbi:MAG: DUF4373 domain-containing protein [Dehalococcoidales bacterium]|nr:DUF4373 domain-containing protein [Dehalococcoidales bacterium]